MILAVVRHGSSKAAATSSLRPTPMSNLLLAMVKKLGIDHKQYGDSTDLLDVQSRDFGRVLNETRPPLTPRLQKSNCALSLKMRGSRISCGVRHVAPYVMFSLITELELSTL